MSNHVRCSMRCWSTQLSSSFLLCWRLWFPCVWFLYTNWFRHVVKRARKLKMVHHVVKNNGQSIQTVTNCWQKYFWTALSMQFQLANSHKKGKGRTNPILCVFVCDHRRCFIRSLLVAEPFILERLSNRTTTFSFQQYFREFTFEGLCFKVVFGYGVGDLKHKEGKKDRRHTCTWL